VKRKLILTTFHSNLPSNLLDGLKEHLSNILVKQYESIEIRPVFDFNDNSYFVKDTNGDRSFFLHLDLLRGDGPFAGDFPLFRKNIQKNSGYDLLVLTKLKNSFRVSCIWSTLAMAWFCRCSRLSRKHMAA
jgi:hypothetical protein